MDENQQPEALELAEILESDLCDYPLDEAAAELRRQHARIAELEAELEAVGAGGVGPLRKRDDSMVRKADVIARLEQGFGAGSAVVMTIKHFFSNELPRQELHQIAEPSRECRQQSATPSALPDGCKIDLPRMREAALDAQVRGYLFKADGSQVRQVIDLLYEKTRELAALQAALPAPAAVAVPECLTCSDHGAVGNILTAEPCPDRTPQEHATQLAGMAQEDARELVANVIVTAVSEKQHTRVEYNWLDHDWQPDPGEYELFAARAAQGGAA